MKQKIIYIKPNNPPDLDELNKLLEEGWIVKICSPQAIAYAGNMSYTKYGAFLVILEKSNLDF